MAAADVQYFPDDPIVEYYTRRDLELFKPHVIYIDDEVVMLTPTGFDLLPDYSASFPTGQADGKVWKALVTTQRGCFSSSQEWVMREYVDNGGPAYSMKVRTIKVIP